MKANDVCKQITDQILSDLKQGTIAWEKPWVGGGFPIPRNCSTQHTAYIQNWIKALESDPKHILAASSQAFKAREYILQLEPTATTATASAIAPTTNHEAQGTRPEPLLAA